MVKLECWIKVYSLTVSAFRFVYSLSVSILFWLWVVKKNSKIRLDHVGQTWFCSESRLGPNWHFSRRWKLFPKDRKLAFKQKMLIYYESTHRAYSFRAVVIKSVKYSSCKLIQSAKVTTANKSWRELVTPLTRINLTCKHLAKRWTNGHP